MASMPQCSTSPCRSQDKDIPSARGGRPRLADAVDIDSKALLQRMTGAANAGNFVKPFSDALASLAKEYTKTPVKSEFGYHAILLEDWRLLDVPLRGNQA